MTNQIPTAVADNLVVQEIDGDLLIYNTNTNKASCLNAATSFIWNSCDGVKSAEDIAEGFNRQFSVEVDSAFVILAINELRTAGLIEPLGMEFSDSDVGKSIVSRRRALLNYALPIALFPMVSTLVAPLAVDAQSVVCTLPCTIGADCPAGSVPCPPGSPWVPGTCSFTCNSGTNCCRIIGAL